MLVVNMKEIKAAGNLTAKNTWNDLLCTEDNSDLTTAILDNHARNAPHIGNHMITGKGGVCAQTSMRKQSLI